MSDIIQNPSVSPTSCHLQTSVAKFFSEMKNLRVKLFIVSLKLLYSLLTIFTPFLTIYSGDVIQYELIVFTYL